MATTYKTLVLPQALPAADTSLYAVATPVTRARIDACTVANTTAGELILTMYIVPPGGSAGASNKLVVSRRLGANESYLCPEVIGQAIEVGGSLWAGGSALGLTIAVSGAEITN